MEEESRRHTFKVQAQKVWHNIGWKATEDRQETPQCLRTKYTGKEEPSHRVAFDSISSVKGGRGNLICFTLAHVRTGVAC